MLVLLLSGHLACQIGNWVSDASLQAKICNDCSLNHNQIIVVLHSHEDFKIGLDIRLYISCTSFRPVKKVVLNHAIVSCLVVNYEQLTLQELLQQIIRVYAAFFLHMEKSKKMFFVVIGVASDP